MIATLSASSAIEDSLMEDFLAPHEPHESGAHDGTYKFSQLY
jgi:hypothetical protein